MSNCRDCKHADWDYVEYYGGGRNKYCFVSDCKLGNDEEDCDDFEEYLDEGDE